MDQVAGMAFLRQQFHQPVLAISGVQPEGQPDKQGTGNDPERNTDPLVHARDEQDDKQEEHHDQTTGEDEQVLRFEPFELYRSSRAFIYLVFPRFRGRKNGEWWQLQSGRYRQRTSWQLSYWCQGRHC